MKFVLLASNISNHFNMSESYDKNNRPSKQIQLFFYLVISIHRINSHFSSIFMFLYDYDQHENDFILLREHFMTFSKCVSSTCMSHYYLSCLIFRKKLFAFVKNRFLLLYCHFIVHMAVNCIVIIGFLEKIVRQEAGGKLFGRKNSFLFLQRF